MDSYDKLEIARYASGDERARASALSAFRHALKNGEAIEGPFMLFMSEVSNRVPDPVLREKYRQMILDMNY